MHGLVQARSGRIEHAGARPMEDPPSNAERVFSKKVGVYGAPSEVPLSPREQRPRRPGGVVLEGAYTHADTNERISLTQAGRMHAANMSVLAGGPLLYFLERVRVRHAPE